MKDINISRQSFFQAAAGLSALGISDLHSATQKKKKSKKINKIQGFEKGKDTSDLYKGWKPVSDRKVRVGIAGYGYCKFGAQFGFQDHPNVEVVAVTDLIPDRCQGLAKACRCKKTYPSCEEMIKDDNIEAVFIATDAPSHARLSISAMNHGKHVASAVPAVFGNNALEDADKLLETVKNTGLVYMLFETSYFHDDLYKWHQLYKAGNLGKIIYSEGEYFHYAKKAIPSYKDWRLGLPPQWYPTHSNAYYTGVSGGSFTEVSCMGIPSITSYLKPENNVYKNPFGTEIALFRTSEGGMSRMAVSWDSHGDHGEKGRIRTQKRMVNDYSIRMKKPPLPPGVHSGQHGGSHGYLMSEFIEAILMKRKPWVDVIHALNMTVAGVIAHKSALKNGELMKIPQYKL